MSHNDVTFSCNVTLTKRSSTGTVIDTWDPTVIDLRLTADSSWTPYAQADITLALDEALAVAIDPTGSPYSLRARIDLSTSDPAGTDQYRPFDLGIRSVVRNYAQGTMTLSVTSDERQIDTFPWTDLTPWTPGAFIDISDIASSVLQIAGNVLWYDAPFSYDVPEDTEWQVGVSAGDYLRPLVDSAGLKLLCDDERRFGLFEPGAVIGPGPTDPRLYDIDDVIDLETRSALDAGPYADDVLVLYEWVDGSGATQRRTDVSTPSGALTPTWHVERPDGSYPGPGAANKIRGRLAQWRYERTFRMLWDLDLRPGIIAAIRDANGHITEGKVHSVTFREDGTMDVVAAYQEYDTGWIQIASTNPDITGDIYYRVVGKEVEIVGEVTGTITLAPVLVNPLPAVIIPTGPEPRLGIAHFGGARIGGVDINDDGWLRILNNFGTQSTCLFQIKYQIG